MSNYLNNIKFSEDKSQIRMKRAKKLFGETFVTKMIAFTLYLLGTTRDDIAHYTLMPKGTLFSLLTRVSKNGLAGLIDQRIQKKRKSEAKTQTATLSCKTDIDGNILLRSGSSESHLSVTSGDILHRKILLLTFLENNLISYEIVAETLNISKRHVSNLCKKLREEGVKGLLDQRIGQKNDYVFSPKIKSELILQFVTNVSSNNKTSGHAIATDLYKRTGLDLAERSVRMHLSKLGLNSLVSKMKEMVCSQKKNSRTHYESI